MTMVIEVFFGCHLEIILDKIVGTHYDELKCDYLWLFFSSRQGIRHNRLKKPINYRSVCVYVFACQWRRMQTISSLYDYGIEFYK